MFALRRSAVLLPFVVLLVAASIAAVVVADEEEEPLLTDDMIDKMNMKSLKRELSLRGVDCDESECYEKKHFKAKLKESKHIKPAADDEAEKKPAAAAADGGEKKDAPNFDINSLRESFMRDREKKKRENAKLRESLKKAGIDTSKMKMSGEDDDFFAKYFEQEDEKKKQKLKK
jgi:hypothetical protein